MAEEIKLEDMKPEDMIDQAKVEAFIEQLKNGATLRDFHGLTDKQMEAFYSVAYNLYQSGKFEDSHQIFKLLCFYDHLELKYWMGLGACRQMTQNYDGAVQAYAQAAMLDIENPQVPLHAADCFLAMGRMEEADSALTAALHFSEGKPQYAAVRNRAEVMQQLLNKDSGSEGE